ncbi:MAG: hypothetical protein JNK14_08605 [Chitinophagaceae bacterium]|nr:hypothetical protein [Chitinophagaceae bacterium]
MKYLTFLPVIALALIACHTSPDKRDAQHLHHFSEKKMPLTYHPGFGDFMANIQVHHAKLWFAGINENWRLADFEKHEIEETLENIKNFKAEKKETPQLSLLSPLLDSIGHSIRTKNVSSFKSNYTQLTNGCNACHRAANHDFINIKTPDISPVPNQSYRPE